MVSVICCVLCIVVFCGAVMCCGFVRCKCLRDYKQCYCTALNIFALESIVNKLDEDVHKLWKCNSEQFESEKYFLLLQLKTSCES